MRTLFIDIETFSSVAVEHGVYRYAEGKDTKILLLSYAFDDGEIVTVDFTAGDSAPEEFIKALSDPNVVKIAHNAEFERIVLSSCLLKMPVGTYLPPEQWSCTMKNAVAVGMPAKLDTLGAKLNIAVS